MDENPILEHFNAPYHRGTLTTATNTGYARSAACGDEVTMYAEIANGTIVSAAFVASGCMVCQAAASILCEFMEKKTTSELNAFNPKAMLDLIGVPLTPRRQQCGILPLMALMNALRFEDG